MDEIWLLVFLPIVLILVGEQQKKNSFILQKWRRKKAAQKGEFSMNKLIQHYIGKECIIATMNNNYNGPIFGVVQDIQDGWVLVQTKRGVQTVNLDYIIHITEFVKKSVKKKNSAWD